MKYFNNADEILKLKPFKGYGVSDNIKNQLNFISKKFDKSYVYKKSIMIANMIKYDIDGDWVSRLISSEKYGRDSSSMESLICRYGEMVGKLLFDEKLKKSTITENSYIEKYGKIAGKIKWDDLCKSKANFSEQHFMGRYGEIEGKLLWNATLAKKLKTQTDNFKNKKWNNGKTLDAYQNKYGVKDGYVRWVARNKRHSYMVSLQRYIDEYGEVDGKIICKDIKNNTSIDKFIKRYGDELGKLRYDENCKKSGITLTKMIELYGDANGTNKYMNWLSAVSHNNNWGGVSKSSQELFWSIYELLNIKNKNVVYFYELNEEYRFYEHRVDTIKLHKVDFKMGKYIIEFDCDYWHNVEADKLRDEFLKTHGYSVLRVRYEDYIKNKKEIVSKCIKYLENET